MKKSSLTAAIFLAALAITTLPAHAATAAELQTTIQGYSGGTGSLSAAVSGNTVTVTGTKTSANSILTLNINAGVTVIWQAELNGYATDYLIDIQGTGSFKMQSGIIGGIKNNSTGEVSISGGTMTQTRGGNPAIHNASTGKITVSGTAEVTSGYVTNYGTIYNSDNGIIEITGGTFNNTSTNYTNSRVIYNGSTGTVNISGGTVSSNAGGAVYNASTGAVNISDGTFSNGSTNASTITSTISNSGGTVSISGGTVSSITGFAVNNGIGKITVSGTAKITSAVTDNMYGALYNSSTGTIEITDGTVENTASGSAVSNNTTGTVNISGGVVKATTGYAVRRQSSGAITLTGGLVFAHGTAANSVISGGYTNTSGNAVITAWDNTQGTTYTAFASTAIFKSAGTAQWLNKDGKAGIDYANGTNIGFLEIDGVTVSKANPATPAELTATYGQTLANISLPVGGWAWASTATTPVGNAGTQTHKANYTPTDAANYNALTNVDVSIAVAKAVGTFGTPAAVSTTYTPTLKLSDLASSLATGYAWTTPTTALNAGNSQSFAATYTDPSGNYNSATGNITVNVAKAKIAKPAAATPSHTYSGIEQSAGIAANDAYTVTGDKQTNAGSHTATVALKDKANYEWTDGTTTDLSLPWSIAKADPDMLGVSFPDQAVTHNGQPHSIYISGELPSGVTVSYTGNGKTELGDYTVTATFIVDEANYNVPAPMTAKLTINNKQTYDMSGIAFADKTVTYSGSPQSLAISGTLLSGVTVSYTGNGKTNAGEYEVTAVFAVANTATHNVPAEMTATLTIEKANYDMSGINFSNASVTHNGNPHSLAITGALPSGVTVSYAGNGQTELGDYTVTATFAVTDPANYNVPEPMTATLEINNKITPDMSGINFSNASVTHNGQPHSLAINGTLPSGVTVSYTGNGQTDVGTYTVTATFAVADPANYNTPAPMTATLTIEASTDPIRFTQTPIGSIRVQATANAIVLENLPKNAKVEVYSLQGKRIYFSNSGNSQILKIQVQTKGMYVVKIGNETMRVAVK